MRLTSLLLLGAAIFRGASAEPEEAQDETRENTYFDGIKVPPIMQLTPDNFEQTVAAHKFLFVKGYSPYCGHCADFAPTWQTIYEFYYTSKPDVTDPETTFTQFYDFHFAELNCVAYGDLCSKHNIRMYPTTVLYVNGAVSEFTTGVKDMSQVSSVIENALEKMKPGSRPAQLALPEPGAKSSPKPTKVQEANDAATTPAAGHGTAATTSATSHGNVSNGSKTQKPAAKKPAKPLTTPNEKGISVALTAESFQKMVTMTQEPWFIKFYAPWCHHCQAMATNWAAMAKHMQGKLNVGEVNCDQESRLCKDVHLRGYPTVLFFKGGERVEYDGLRGVGDFISYAQKAIDVSGGVQDVDAASFKALEETEEVIFVYFYDHATTSEDFMALERLPLSLIGHAKVVKTKDPALYERFKITTWPRLLVSREGRPTYYNPLTPHEMRDVHGVLNWMKSVWLPIVPELTAANARELMDGKIVVLGVLNRDDKESWLAGRREIKSAAGEWMDKQILDFQRERQELRNAKQLRIEEAEDRNDQRALRTAKNMRINMDRSDRKEVAFAWVDGVFWQRWIRTTYGIDVKDGERVIINDEDNRRYWDQTITGNYILPSRTSILDTLKQVVASPPKIKPKLTISSFEKIFFDIRVTFSEHPFLTIGCILGLGLGAASWLRGRARRRGGAFRLDDQFPGLKEGLLGNTVNGKND